MRHYAGEIGVALEVVSAGTEETRVKPEAVKVMQEVGIDISSHTSKTLFDLPDPWAFDVVLTVCDSANEACPAYPAKTERLHVSFPDPSAESLARWREVRDATSQMSQTFVAALQSGGLPTEAELEVGL